MRKSKKRPWKFAAAGVFAALAALCGGSAYLAHQIAKPKGKTLERERGWEIIHGMWGDFDHYRRTPYIVRGMDDYVLHCEYIEKDPESRNFVILTHGYTSNRYGMAKYIGVYRKLGFNCIIYDCRDHGENAAAACSIGNFESQDLRHVIDDAYERFGADIRLGLHGESMGSSTSLSVLKFRPKVEFVVADCGFENLYELIGEGYRALHIGFMLRPVNAMLKLLYHFDMKDTSARDALKGNTVPICLIHGAADTFIPPKNSEGLAKATSGYSEVHLAEGAEHAKSREVMGEEAYRRIIRAFLEKTGYLQPENA